MNDLIDPSTSINNVELGKDVKIAKGVYFWLRLSETENRIIHISE